MALIKYILLDSGITLPEAYVKIVNVEYSNKVGEPPFAQIKLNIYKDQQARVDERPEVITMEFRCSGNDFDNYLSLSVLDEVDKNLISQCYSWLKTTKLFSGSTDVVDVEEN